MVPMIYNSEELDEILRDNNIDVADIKECREFMSFYGWTIKKRKKVENQDRLVLYKGVFKRVMDFTGIEIHIMKDDKIIGALMENERDALLVCILKVIREGLQ